VPQRSPKAPRKGDTGLGQQEMGGTPPWVTKRRGTILLKSEIKRYAPIPRNGWGNPGTETGRTTRKTRAKLRISPLREERVSDRGYRELEEIKRRVAQGNTPRPRTGITPSQLRRKGGGTGNKTITGKGDAKKNRFVTSNRKGLFKFMRGKGSHTPNNNHQKPNHPKNTPPKTPTHPPQNTQNQKKKPKKKGRAGEHCL